MILCTEEEQCEDLLLFMQMLIHLPTKHSSEYSDHGKYNTRTVRTNFTVTLMSIAWQWYL